MHYYDKIGLLKPDSKTHSGYQCYSDHNLEKLQQVLFFKELGFRLQEIGEILDNPNYDLKQALQKQRKLLIKKKERLNDLIGLLEKTLSSLEGGSKMAKEDMFASFDMSEIENHQKQYAEEVKQKYSNSRAYKESQKKTSSYTKKGWVAIIARGHEIYTSLALFMDREPMIRRCKW